MKPNQLYLLLTVLSIAGYGWLGFHLSQKEIPKTEQGHFSLESCMFKSVTGIPCPACGTTRSVLHIAHGDVQQAALINPLGFVATLFLVLIPCWLLYDVVSKRRSLFHTYARAEQIIKTKRWVALPLILLVLMNWMWNIIKSN